MGLKFSGVGDKPESMGVDFELVFWRFLRFWLNFLSFCWNLRNFICLSVKNVEFEQF
jgi:hypothetical protein